MVHSWLGVIDGWEWLVDLELIVNIWWKSLEASVSVGWHEPAIGPFWCGFPQTGQLENKIFPLLHSWIHVVSSFPNKAN